MTLIATPGATTANSYVTVARAKVLLNERLDAAEWIAAPTLEQEQSLIWATRLIEQKTRWQVTSVLGTQALWWPVSDGVDAQGLAYPFDSIPLFLERATAVYALALWTAWKQQRDERLHRFHSGTVTLEFVPGGIRPHDRMPAEVQEELLPYGAIVGGGMIPVLRV